MIRLRRSAQFPLIFLSVLLIVFCGSRTFLLEYNQESAMYEAEDPMDVDVPISVGNRFLSVQDDGKETAGQGFPEEVMQMTKFFDQIQGSAVSTFKDDEVVYVTYASANHFSESRESIRRLRKITNSTLIYYDLGLTQSQEMYKKYQAFWVIDASARFFSSEELTKFYDKIRKGVIEPFSAEHPAGHTILSATSEQMYNYLPLSQEGRESGMRQALTMFVVRSKLAREIVKWNMICALTEKCISPPGTTPHCGIQRSIKGSQCHRFDQSSVNVILCALNMRRKVPCLASTETTGAYSSLVGVSRDTIYDGPLPTC